MQDFLVRKVVEPTRATKLSFAPDPREIISDVLISQPGLIVEAVSLTETEAEQRRGREHILSVERDVTVSAPEPGVRAETDSPLAFTPSSVLMATGADEAHRLGHRGRGMRIAVLDTGYGSDTKRELGSRVFHASSVVPDEGPENADDTHGDWCLQMVAHIAPEAEYAVIKCLSGKTGSGATSGTIKAVESARELGCTHVSASLGGPKSEASNAAFDAVARSGVLCFVAAGNDQRGKSDSDYVADRTSPASAAEVLTVAAADDAMRVAGFSNRGTCLDLSGPGVDVKAPNVDSLWSGSSMSTPCAAALSALYRSAGLSAAETKQAMRANAINTGAPPTAEGNGFAFFEPPPGPPKPPKPPGSPGVAVVSYSRLALEKKPLGRTVRVTWRGKPFLRALPPE